MITPEAPHIYFTPTGECIRAALALLDSSPQLSSLKTVPEVQTISTQAKLRLAHIAATVQLEIKKNPSLADTQLTILAKELVVYRNNTELLTEISKFRKDPVTEVLYFPR